jgi:serine/threonine protein phosphatase PrpC
MDLVNSKFGLISKTLCDRGKSHCGDYVLTGVDNTGRLVVMALSDGVGTRHHDYVASQTACESFKESFMNANDMELEERFIFSIKQADQYVSYPTEASHKGMMATLVAVVWDTENDKVLFDTIGDSRLYLYSNNSLKQISVDSKKAVIRRDPAGKIIKQSGVFAIHFGLTNVQPLLPHRLQQLQCKYIPFIITKVP